jgi:hypothetical protein
LERRKGGAVIEDEMARLINENKRLIYENNELKKNK